MSVKSTFLQIDELGEPHKVLKKCETQLDSPKANEVLVKILASPINPAVINIIQGISNEFLNHLCFSKRIDSSNRQIW